MDDQGEIYFHVEGVTIYDLYDWSHGRHNSSEVLLCKALATWQKSVPARSPSRKSSLRTGHLVRVNEQEVALFRYGSVVYAISERCPHAGGPLHIGDIETLPDRSLCVRCPYHGWKFNLKTGKCCHPRSRSDLSAMVFPVRVCSTSGEMAVGFHEFSPQYFRTLME